MQKIGGSRRLVRSVGVGVLFGSLLLGFGAMASNADELPTPTDSATTPSTPTDSATTPSTPTDSATTPSTGDKGSLPQATIMSTPAGAPYGSSYPVTLETDFSRPYKAISSVANSDFSLLNDLERLIKGSYWDPRTNKERPWAERKANHVYLSISRMENSHRVGRELVKAAKAGVKVRVIHGKASQSKESRALERSLNSSKLRDAHFKICQKGKSLACLSNLPSAIMHSKILLIGNTFTRDKEPAKSAIWSGSANLGGPSGERTYNNGLTVYNDKKLWEQTSDMWADMYAERNVGNNYLHYIAAHDGNGRYGYTGAKADGYTSDYASNGMFYSNLSKVTIYATPIQATPTNGKDPVLNLLNRVVPDDQCHIRLQENRFKYRRIAVAQKLVQLADDGCDIAAVSFQDDLAVNRAAHCQQYIRICRPILDVLKTASRHIDVGWAKPHDKTILVDAKLKSNPLNREEVVVVDGTTYGRTASGSVHLWPSSGIREQLVLAGSAALTGSNLVVSDEITTETTDASVYDDYLQHWKAIEKSRNFRNYPY